MNASVRATFRQSVRAASGSQQPTLSEGNRARGDFAMVSGAYPFADGGCAAHISTGNEEFLPDE
jgi:hypothetical protein